MSHTYIHFARSRDADTFEEFVKDKLPDDEIFVPEQHQPLNPEEEDDVVPDQHAAFGIQRATLKAKEPAWRDLGLEALMKKGPGGQGAPGLKKGGGRDKGGFSWMGNRTLPR